MSSKVKSLIYLGCFILAVIVYQQSSLELTANKVYDQTEITEIHAQDETYQSTFIATPSE